MIRTDHKSIKELRQQVIQTVVQQQYVKKLLWFDFSIEYKARSSNKAVDALSRIYEEEELIESIFLDLSTPIPMLDEVCDGSRAVSNCITDSVWGRGTKLFSWR